MWCRWIIRASIKSGYARCGCHTAALDFRDVPSPKGLPVVGTTFSLLAAGGPSKLHEYVDKRHKRLGPIFKDNVGPVTAVFLSDPEMMRAIFAQEGKCPFHIKPEPWMVYNERHNYSRGLFFMDGDKWLHYRRIMNKLLLKGDLSWIDLSCSAASDLIFKRILHHSEENSEVPHLEKELYKWSMDVIVSVLVGADTYKQSHEAMDPLVENLAATVQLVFETTSKLTLIPAAQAARFKIPRWKRFEDSVTIALESANEVVDHLDKKFPKSDGLLHKMDEESVDKIERNRIVTDLILGGGDTTTYTMEWMLYLIGKNKDVQQRLRQDDKSLLKNVLKETLRLYPVAPFLTRFMTEDVIVGGYKIPAGTLIVMSIYTSGRDERYFKNAGQFWPDRWLRSSTSGTVNTQQASLPFAIGARSCIGRKIAEAQLQTTLWKIVRSFDVEVCNEDDIAVVMKMVAKPGAPLRLKFNKI